MWVLLAVLACAVTPVDGPVIDPYRPPACAWCPGNRGVDFGTVPGSPVRSVQAGVVTFAGQVVEVRYLVVALGDGRRVTYGGLAQIDVSVGERVEAGQVVGTTTTVLHLGLRRGDRYENPMGLLSGRTRARLVRLDGRHRPPSASIPCGSATAVPSSRTNSRVPPAVA